MTCILLVDSDPTARERIASLVRPTAVVAEAYDAASAAENVPTGHDLVIVRSSEGLDGIAVITAMREAGNLSSVILVIPELTPALVGELAPLRIDDYLLHSFTDGELVVRVHKVLSAPAGTLAPVPVPAISPVVDAAEQRLDLVTKDGPVMPVRAVLMGVAQGDATAVSTELRERGLQAYAGASDLLKVVRKDPWCVMIIAQLSGLTRFEIEALRQVLYDKPSIKLVLIATPQHERAVHLFSVLGYARSLPEPFDAAMVARSAIEELAGHHFDSRVVDALRTSMLRILGNTPISIKPAQVAMRVSSQALARTTALVEVSGSDLVGRLTLSGEPRVLNRLARHWLGDEPRTHDYMLDAIGELANRLASDVRNHYYARGLTSHQSPPLVIEGTDISIRQHTKMPGLAFSFQIDTHSDDAASDAFNVEWFISHKSGVEFEVAGSEVSEEDIAFF